GPSTPSPDQPPQPARRKLLPSPGVKGDMKVRLIVTSLVAVAAGVSMVSGASGATAPPPRSQLTGFACTHALDPSDRAIGVQAVMRPLTGTRRLAIRFELLKRPLGQPAQTVAGGDLGLWKTPPEPTLGQRSGDV